VKPRLTHRKFPPPSPEISRNGERRHSIADLFSPRFHFAARRFFLGPQELEDINASRTLKLIEYHTLMSGPEKEEVQGRGDASWGRVRRPGCWVCVCFFGGGGQRRLPFSIPTIAECSLR